MKIKLLIGTTFRGKKLKKNKIIDMPIGVASKLIGRGLAIKV